MSGGARAAERVRTFASGHPLLVDAVLVVVVVVGAVIGDAYDGDPRGPAWAFDLCLPLPLVARRHWPTPVFLAVAAVAFGQWSVGVPARADICILVALYTVGAYEPRRRLVAVAAAVAEVGVVLATLRWAPTGHDWTAGLLLTGTCTAAWVVGSYVRTRRAYLAAVLERAATAERDRDQQAQIAVAAERGRIAREMHDVVAHSLSVMIALSDGAAATVRADPVEARAVMGQASSVGRESLAEMRRLLGVLRSSDDDHDGDVASPQPVDDQLADLVERVRAAGLPVRLVVSGVPVQSSPGAALAAHRIVQESLTNVLKHAPHATGTRVSLRYEADAIDIEVVNDTDHPARTAVAAVTTGHGLIGMRERALLFGGQLRAGPAADGSWHVRTRLLLDQGRGRAGSPA